VLVWDLAPRAHLVHPKGGDGGGNGGGGLNTGHGVLHELPSLEFDC
jgi:hypothetical protein